MHRIHKKFYAACIAGMVFIPAGVFAEELVGVRTKALYARNDSGIQAGSFIYRPAITVGGVYDDNVFSDRDNTRSDIITTVSPSMNIASDFGLHSVSFNSSGNFGFHKEFEDENYKDYSIGASGTLDLDYSTALSASLSHAQMHEGRDSVDNPGSDEPIEYTLSSIKSGFTRALGIIKLYLNAAGERLRFDDATLNGVSFSNSGRDRDIYTFSGKVAYEYMPGYNIFISSMFDTRQYVEDEASDRDSKGQEIQVGADMSITGKVSAEIYGGSLRRSYSDDLSDIDTVNYGASLLWNVTPITSVIGRLDRGVEETTFGDASGNIQTRLSVDVEHAVRENLFLLTGASYTIDDYEGAERGDQGRQDKTIAAGVALEYSPLRGVDLKLGYGYRQRDSENYEDNYKNNLVTLSVTKRF